MSPGTDLGQMLLVSYKGAMSSGGDVVTGLRPPIPLFFFFTTKVLFLFCSFSFCNIMQMFGVSRSMWIKLFCRMSFDCFLQAASPQGYP